MEREVATIVRLLDPSGRIPTYEFDLPLKMSDLPPKLWKETNDHFSGVFQQRSDGPPNEYEVVRPMSRKEAMASGITCF